MPTSTNRHRNALKGSWRAYNKHRVIREQLKAENALEWTRRMNNIRACAREIVNEEIIYA